MANTVPDSIYYPQGTDSVAPLQTTLSTMAASVQTAFSKRQGYNYKWQNTSARNQQTGMRAGDTGYQIDNKTTYSYDGANWQTQEKSVSTWPQGPSLPANGSAVNAPPAGTILIRRIQYVSGLTNGAGTLGRISFAEPFPNGLLHISMTTIRNASVNPVIDGGNIDRLGFAPIWPGNPNANVQFTYEAIGW